MYKLLDIAKKYDGLDEYKDTVVLESLLGIDPSVTPWCSHFVSAVVKEAGYEPHVGKASGWQNWGERCGKEPGAIVVFNSHVAFLDDQPGHILGGNQSNKICSQPIQYYGTPICYVKPKEDFDELVNVNVDPATDKLPAEQVETEDDYLAKMLSDIYENTNKIPELETSLLKVSQLLEAVEQKLAEIAVDKTQPPTPAPTPTRPSSVFERMRRKA